MSELKETDFGNIAFDWNFIPSLEFCIKITDGTHDSPKQQETGKHLVTSKHIKGRKVDFESAYLISQKDFENIKEADKEGERLGLTKDEVAFYNALEVNDSAVQVLGDEQLREIAREITEKVKANATIDWTIRESARAKLMVIVRRTLTKWGYPPDKQPKAIETVLKQAELMADHFVEQL